MDPSNMDPSNMDPSNMDPSVSGYFPILLVRNDSSLWELDLDDWYTCDEILDLLSDAPVETSALVEFVNAGHVPHVRHMREVSDEFPTVVR